MPRRLPKGCVEDKDRHGNFRVYYRDPQTKKKTRIRGIPWSEAFMKAYADAMGDKEAPKVRSQKGTFRWLCQQYFESAEYKRLDHKTQRTRRLNLIHICDELVDSKKPEGKRIGDCPLSYITTRAIRFLRDRKASVPMQANEWLKDLRQLFRYGLDAEVEGVERNPARDVPRLPPLNPEGHHSWTIEEIERFESHWPIGTKPRLAMALLLYTGQRSGDVRLFGRQHVKQIDGAPWLVFTQQKNRRNKPVQMQIPIVPALAEIIETSPCGELTFLVAHTGKPYSAIGFANWFGKCCDSAGVPGRAHGLRKAVAARLAEHGATAKEIAAITGHSTLKEITRYTAGAEQKVLASSAMTKLVGNNDG